MAGLFEGAGHPIDENEKQNFNLRTGNSLTYFRRLWLPLARLVV